jgi:type VI secretion system protein ImpJ
VERLLDHHLGLASPYHYGVVRLDIDPGRLAAGELRVEVDAVLPDRLVVRTRGEVLGARFDPVALAEKAEAGDRRAVGVFLAVPRERAGSAASGEGARFQASLGDRVADDTTGANEVEVPRLVPDARLVVDVDPPADAAWICLAEVRLEGGAATLAEYQPPLLQVSPDTALFGLCARLVEALRGAASRAAERLDPATDRALLAEGRRKIYHLTAALPAFEAALLGGEAHPFALYLAIGHVLGHLAPLSAAPVPPPPPQYQHDDLRATFAAIEARVLGVIGEAT